MVLNINIYQYVSGILTPCSGLINNEETTTCVYIYTNFPEFSANHMPFKTSKEIKPRFSQGNGIVVLNEHKAKYFRTF